MENKACCEFALDENMPAANNSIANSGAGRYKIPAHQQVNGVRNFKRPIL